MKKFVILAAVGMLSALPAKAEMIECQSLLRFRAASALGLDTADVEVTLTAAPPLEGSFDEYTFRFASIPRGRVVVTATTPFGRTASFTADVHVWGDVLVASGAINRLAVLDASQFVRARRDITQLSPIPPDQIDGMRARTRISAGAVLTADRVETIPPVDRGAVVFVTTTRGSIRVTRTGMALSDGQLGEFVRVRVSDRKVIQAKVTGPNECVIGS